MAPFDFQRPDTLRRRSMVLLVVDRDGEITGAARAFVATLSPDVSLSTLSHRPSTCWKQFFSPFERPIRAKKGDAVLIETLLEEPEHPGVGLTTRTVHVPKDGIPDFVARLRAGSS